MMLFIVRKKPGKVAIYISQHGAPQLHCRSFLCKIYIVLTNVQHPTFV